MNLRQRPSFQPANLAPPHSPQSPLWVSGRNAQAVRTDSHLPALLGQFLGFLLLLGFMSNYVDSTFSVIGKASVLAVLTCIPFISCFLLRRKGTLLKIPVMTLVLFLVLIIIGIASISNSIPLMDAGKTIFQLVAIFSFLIVMTNWSWNERALRNLGLLMTVFILSNLMLWLQTGMSHSFQGWMINSNSLGALLFFASFFVVAPLCISTPTRLYKYSVIFVFIADIICVWATNTRSAWLAIITCGVLWCVWKVLKKSRTLFYAAFPLSIFLIFAFGYFYINSAALPISGYEQQVMAYSGKRLNTGRQILWPELFNDIRREPLLGHGVGYSTGDLSAHNLFIELALQIGLVGLGVFLLLMWTLWNALWPGRDDPLVRLSGAFLLAILMHQMFEVTLTQNNLSIGMLQWMIIIIGISRTALVGSVPQSTGRFPHRLG